MKYTWRQRWKFWIHFPLISFFLNAHHLFRSFPSLLSEGTTCAGCKWEPTWREPTPSNTVTVTNSIFKLRNHEFVSSDSRTCDWNFHNSARFIHSRQTTWTNYINRNIPGTLSPTIQAVAFDSTFSTGCFCKDPMHWIISFACNTPWLHCNHIWFG